MSSNIVKPVIFAVAAVVAFTASVASAQEPGRVAILDVAKVFKENKIFADGLLALPAQADEFKRRVIAERDAIKAESMRLRGKPASPYRNQQEAELKQRRTALRTAVRQNEAELVDREARVYFDTYREMKAVVEAIAEEHNIKLVLALNQCFGKRQHMEIFRFLKDPFWVKYGFIN